MNKKLIKTIARITCGLGMISAVPIISASCGCSNEQSIKALPESVYDIDENNVLQGFKNDFINNPDSEIYQDNFKDCDTMEIPARVTTINQGAFAVTYIPQYITKLTFAKESALSSINDSAFYNTSSPLTSVDLSNCTSLTALNGGPFYNCKSLTFVTFPNSLTTFGYNAFESCPKLNDIKWNLSAEYQTKMNIGSSSFSGISSSGKIESLNKKIASSQELLDWIRNKGGFPSTGWTPVN